MLHRKSTVVLAIVVGALGALTTACSALSRPEEITISAEPAAAKAAPKAPAAPQQVIPAGGQEQGG